MPHSPVRSATYREIARQVAARLAASRAGADPLAAWPEEVVVASAGLAGAITRELLTHIPNGVAGLQLQTLETLGRGIVNAAGEFPRVANDAGRRLGMRAAVRLVDDAMLESRGIAAMLERSYRDVRDSGFTLRAFERRVHSAERSLRSARRTRTIIEVWYAYERLISRLGAIDPADLIERARDGVRTKTRIRADEADADTRRFRIAAGTSAELRLIRRNSRAVDDYINVVAQLEALTELSPVELLTAPLFRLETETDLAPADEIAEVAELFQRAKTWNIRFDNAAVIDALEQRTLIAKPSGSIFLGDVMKFRGRSFEHLFLIRAQDDLFPQRRNED